MEARGPGCSMYVAKQCGLVLEPPALILVYEDSISHKLRRRSMPVRNLSAHDSTSVHLAASELRVRHKRYLDPGVPHVIVEKMLRILQEHMRGLDLKEALAVVRPEFEVGENEDLNCLSEDALRRKKDAMEHAFSKTRLRPGDPGFEYDKRVEFPQPELASEWDEGQLQSPPSPPLPTPQQQQQQQQQPGWGDSPAGNVDDDNEFWD